MAAIPPKMAGLLAAAPDGSTVAVVSMLGSLCPVTLGHVRMFEEARAVLCDHMPRTCALAPRPAALPAYHEMLGFFRLNGDYHVSSKLSQKGLAALPAEQRAELIELATADVPWLACQGRGGGAEATVQALAALWPRLVFTHFDMNGADDVVKYAKWQWTGTRQLAMGRPGATANMVALARAAGTDMDNGFFIVGPELPDVSSSAARQAVAAADTAALATLLHPRVTAWHLDRNWTYAPGQAAAAAQGLGAPRTPPPRHPLAGAPQSAPRLHSRGGGRGATSQAPPSSFGTCQVQRPDLMRTTLLRSEKTTEQRSFIDGALVPSGEVVAVLAVEPPFAWVSYSSAHVRRAVRHAGYIQLRYLCGGRRVIVQCQDDGVGATALRFEKTAEQRAFTGTLVRNRDAVEVLWAEGPWAYVRANGGAEGYVQTKHCPSLRAQVPP